MSPRTVHKNEPQWNMSPYFPTSRDSDCSIVTVNVRFYWLLIMKWRQFYSTTFGCSSGVCLTRNIPPLIFWKRLSVTGGILHEWINDEKVQIFNKKIVYETGNSAYKVNQLLSACCSINYINWNKKFRRGQYLLITNGVFIKLTWSFE